MGIIGQLSMSLGLASFLSWIYFNITNDGRRALHQLHPNPLLNLGLLLFAIGPLAHITRLRLSKKTRFSTALIHSLTQFVLLVAIILYTGFVLNVTHKTDATDLPGKTYKEYHSVDGYSGSFRPYGSRPNGTRDPVWIDIRKSLSNSKICEKFADKYKNLTASEFYNSRFSIIEAACCKPPLLNCELHYENSSFWYESYFDLIPNSATIRRPRSSMVAGFLLGSPPPRVGTPLSENLNCSSWDNKHRCFSCEECYSGVLDNIRKEWRQMAVLNIFVIFITVVFFILSIVHRRQLVGIKPTGGIFTNMYRVSRTRFKRPAAMGIIGQLSMSLGLASFLSWIYFNITNDGRRSLHQLHPNPLLNLGLLLFAIGPLAHIIRLRLFKKTRFSTALIHSLTQFVLLVAIVLYTGFVLNVTHKTDATDLPGKTYKEYRSVDGYSSRFQPYGSRSKNTRDPVWIDIRKSLSNSKICEKFADKYKNLNASEFYNSHFSIIEAACCKPPLLNCQLEYKNSSYWHHKYLDWIANFGRIPPRPEPEWEVLLLPSCSAWNNEHRCFACEECYSGVLDNIRMEWRQMAVLNISVIFITVVFFILSLVHWQLIEIKAKK